MSNITNLENLLLSSVYRLPSQISRNERVQDARTRSLLNYLLVIPSLFHSLYLNLLRVKWNGKVNLAVVAIVKNEAPYLVEWIEYYRSIGFEKFYLYDNDSSDGMRELLNPYIDAGIVEYAAVSGKARQLDAYNNALNKHSADCKYLAFFDIDEFINFGEYDPLDWLDEHFVDGVAAIGFNWLTFGSGGHITKPEGLVIENYTRRSVPAFDRNEHVKTITNPRKILGYSNPHFAVPLIGYREVNVNGEAFEGPLSPESRTDTPPVINHYFTKSKVEFESKRSRGRANRRTMLAEDEFEKHDRNEVLDESMLRKVPEVKRRIAYLRENGRPLS